MKKFLFLAICVLPACSILAQDIPELPIPQLLGKLSAAPNDTARLHLLLRIADAYVLKPGEDPHDLDSAFLLIGQVEKANTATPDPYIRDLTLLVKARASREKGNKDLGKKYAFQALEAFRNVRDQHLAELAYADNEAANYLDYVNVEQDSQRIELYREAVPLFEKTGNKSMQASTLQIMGDCISANYHFVEAISPLLQSLNIYRSIGHDDVRDVCGLLGEAYSHIGDHRKALTYSLMAMKIEDTMPFSYMRYLSNLRIGALYHRLGDFATSETYSLRALIAAKQLRDTDAIRAATHNWINARIQQKKYDSALLNLDQVNRQYPPPSIDSKVYMLDLYCAIYRQRKQLNLAFPIVREFIRIDSTLGPDDPLHSFCDGDIVKYYLATKNWNLAHQYGNHYVEYCTRNRLSYLLGNAYYWLVQADSAAGNPKGALAEYQQYVHIKDSLLDADKGKQIAAMQIEFDTEKKDKDIRNLTQKQQLDQLTIHQAGITRNFIVGGAALLLVLLVVSVNRYRLKQRSNRQLGRLLTEKEWLVKEIHHRVKNNLHVISGLLDSQAGFLKSEEAVAAIRDSQHRVNAMSLIHQKLYQTNNLSDTDMSAYISEFAAYLGASYSCGSRIRIIVDVERLQFGLAYTIPLGLILNEAVTNAIKYAFPGGRKGEITIKLQKLSDRRYQLSIADDGIGLASNALKETRSSMGMSLIRGLTEDIGGELSIDGSSGTRIEIIFVYETAA